MTDTTQVDSTAAREAAMSRVQTQDTVLASLAAPASQEGAPGSKEQVAKDKPNEEDQKPSKKTAQERIVELAHKPLAHRLDRGAQARTQARVVQVALDGLAGALAGGSNVGHERIALLSTRRLVRPRVRAATKQAPEIFRKALN